jgi:hypothetical protein
VDVGFNSLLRRLRPGELAGLLEDLGRAERRDLLARLAPDRAADALEEMQQEELVQLLRESGTAEAAELLGRMEPDEAADGLRELDPGEQEKLLAAMPAQARDRVATLLGYGERTAGGIMTTVLVLATPAETIMQVRDRLRANREHDEDLAGVIVLVAGRFATQLFAVGLLGASALAAAVVPLSTAYAISEARGAERSVSKSFRQAPVFLGLFTGQVFIGAAVALIPGNLIQLLVEAQVLNGLITPILLTYVLILANRSSVLGDAANGRALKVVATISVAAVAVISLTVLVQAVLSGFGIS